MAKLLAIDLDGTLFYPKNIRRCICKKNVKFLRRWIDAGNKVVLVTSRSTQFTERLKDEIKRPVDFIMLFLHRGLTGTRSTLLPCAW